MKKLAKVLVCVLSLTMMLAAGGCGSQGSGSASADDQEFTVQAMVDANSREALLAKYDNIYVEYSSDYSDNGIALYSDADCTYVYYSSREYDTVYTEDGWFYYSPDKSDKSLVYGWYAMSDEEKADNAYTMDKIDAVVDEEGTLKEELLDTVDNGDGTMTVTTQLSVEDADLNMDNVPEAFQDVETVEFVYVVDKETFEISSMETILRTDDDEMVYDTGTVTYNVAEPAEAAAALSQIEEFNSVEPADPKTIKVVYDYGTDDEQEYEITLDKKFMVRPLFRDGYTTQYMDPDKTTEYKGSSGDEDATIYLFYGL